MKGISSFVANLLMNKYINQMVLQLIVHGEPGKPGQIALIPVEPAMVQEIKREIESQTDRGKMVELTARKLHQMTSPAPMNAQVIKQIGWLDD